MAIVLSFPSSFKLLLSAMDGKYGKFSFVYFLLNNV
jgi:hypothetical protein